jgi:hypothetical protein
MNGIQRLWTAGGSKHRTSFVVPLKTAAYAGIDIAAGRNDVVVRACARRQPNQMPDLKRAPRSQPCDVDSLRSV